MPHPWMTAGDRLQTVAHKAGHTAERAPVRGLGGAGPAPAASPRRPPAAPAVGPQRRAQRTRHRQPGPLAASSNLPVASRRRPDRADRSPGGGLRQDTASETTGVRGEAGAATAGPQAAADTEPKGAQSGACATACPTTTRATAEACGYGFQLRRPTGGGAVPATGRGAGNGRALGRVGRRQRGASARARSCPRICRPRFSRAGKKKPLAGRLVACLGGPKSGVEGILPGLDDAAHGSRGLRVK